MKRTPILCFVFVATLFFSACYTVPQTGRRSLSLISPSQEMQMGVSSFSQIKQKEKVSQDKELNDRVQRIGKRIAAAVDDDLPDAQWEFVVFENAEANAFALPGGKVGVYTGLMKLATTDDELAIVIGHEIAHVTARHGAERVSQGMVIAGVGVALSEGVLRDNKNRELWMAAYGAGATVGVMLPYSRLNESEADEIGLLYAAKAGYDPRAAVVFWEKMRKNSAGKTRPPEWLSTHPADETRIQKIRQLLPRVLPIYEANKSS